MTVEAFIAALEKDYAVDARDLIQSPAPDGMVILTRQLIRTVAGKRARVPLQYFKETENIAPNVARRILNRLSIKDFTHDLGRGF